MAKKKKKPTKEVALDGVDVKAGVGSRELDV